jgi:hypothetical protein
MLARTHDWFEGLPRELAAAVRRADGARAICYLIARRDEGVPAMDRVVARDDAEAAPMYEALATLVSRQSAVRQLALADLAAPALHSLGRQGYARFRSTLAELMRTDKKVDLREWALSKSLERHVERRFLTGPAHAFGRLTSMEAQVRTVLAIIAISEHGAVEQQGAYDRGCAQLGLGTRRIPDVGLLTLDALNDAVKRLSQLRFEDRGRMLEACGRMLEACAATAMHDGDANMNEFLVVRAVADALDVPIPALELA